MRLARECIHAQEAATLSERRKEEMQWRHRRPVAPNCQDETELMSLGPGLSPNTERELLLATRLPCERKYVLHGTSRAQNLFYITQIKGHATIDYEVSADGDIAVCFVPGLVFYQLDQRQLLRDKSLCPCQNSRTCTTRSCTWMERFE